MKCQLVSLVSYVHVINQLSLSYMEQLPSLGKGAQHFM